MARKEGESSLARVEGGYAKDYALSVAQGNYERAMDSAEKMARHYQSIKKPTKEDKEKESAWYGRAGEAAFAGCMKSGEFADARDIAREMREYFQSRGGKKEQNFWYEKSREADFSEYMHEGKFDSARAAAKQMRKYHKSEGRAEESKSWTSRRIESRFAKYLGKKDFDKAIRLSGKMFNYYESKGNNEGADFWSGKALEALEKQEEYAARMAYANKKRRGEFQFQIRSSEETPVRTNREESRLVEKVTTAFLAFASISCMISAFRNISTNITGQAISRGAAAGASLIGAVLILLGMLSAYLALMRSKNESCL